MASGPGPKPPQQGCKSLLPPCLVTDDDLTAYPGLANLLMALTKRMDSSGLNVGLGQRLEEAKKELHLHRASWLKWEALHRLLREALSQSGTNPAPLDKKFLEILEQQLLVAELKRMLHPDPSLQNPRPPLLGLEPSHLRMLLPCGQEQEQMQALLPAELEKLLKAKCLAVLSYYRPESDTAGGVAQTSMLRTLAENLALEKQQLKEASARQEELLGWLEQQKAAYPKVLLRCLAILKRLACEFRLGAQSELDQLNTQYLEVKCSAMFLKIRLEELNILLETYTPEKVEVHRVMRDSLQATLSQEEEELAASQKILSNYEILGPEFEELVKEYTRLQAIIENRRWVLTEFNKD